MQNIVNIKKLYSDVLSGMTNTFNPKDLICLQPSNKYTADTMKQSACNAKIAINVINHSFHDFPPSYR